MAYTVPMRRLYYLFALLFVAIGGLGTVVPLLPTTPFVLLSAWAAARGNPALNRWLHDHPRFGPFLANWERGRSIDRRAKLRMISLIAASWVILFLIFDRLMVPALAGICMGAVAVWLATRPEPAKSGNAAGGEPPGEGLGLSVPLGIGTMMWGATPLDRRVNGRLLSLEELKGIRRVAHSAGVSFVDTAEGYGGGTCERNVRRAGFHPGNSLIATKFLPTLGRWSAHSVVRSARRSCRRLGVDRIDLLYIHSPVHLRRPDVWIRGAARAVREGVVRSIGVSNFSAAQLCRALRVAREEGVEIVSNQIMFSPLVYGDRELRRTVDMCRRHGVAVVGFATVGQGLLGECLSDERFRRSRLVRIAGLRRESLEELRCVLADVAEEHGSTMSQVAIQWSISKGVVPLVGTRSVGQLNDSLGALSIVLSRQEIDRIDTVALSHSTFRRSRRRRFAFVLFISTLMVAYRLSGLFA